MHPPVRSSFARRATSACLLALAASAALSANASAAWPPVNSTENATASWARFPQTSASVVTINAPLPSTVAAHPAECDKLKFLRMKLSTGPSDPSNADAVYTMMPGILEGATAFENVGRNLITRAWNERGKKIEVWAIDRRANCLEDITGIQKARQTQNPQDLLDYYYGGASIGGKTFAGFQTSANNAWLADIGLKQTLSDWYQVMAQGMPNQATRKAKLFCGGHSLGGVLTGEFLTYDHDGNAATTADAGYNQCRGTFALDSFVTADPVEIGQLTEITGTSLIPTSINDGAVNLIKSGALSRFVDLPGINPEVMYFLTAIGFMADLAPAAENTFLTSAPETTKIKEAQALYFSSDLTNYLTQYPDIRDYRFTNRALLGTFTDDNSYPISVVQASTGFYKGGSVAIKQFPAPDFLTSVPILGPFIDLGLGTGDLAIPTNYGWWPGLRNGPLYDWMNYNEVTSTNVPRKWLFGPRFTSPSREVTDINDLAHGVSGGELNFVEAYYPTRMPLEASIGLFGASAAANNLLHPNGFNAVSRINICGAEGIAPLGMPIVDPNCTLVPGYNHIDVLTAAATQNNGQPEPVTTALLNYSAL